MMISFLNLSAIRNGYSTYERTFQSQNSCIVYIRTLAFHTEWLKYEHCFGFHVSKDAAKLSHGWDLSLQ